MRIALIEYGAGNPISVQRAFRQLGVQAECVTDPASLGKANALVLPGVGHFGALMRTLEERQLVTPLRKALARGVPFLGVCLGLQVLYESSAEAPGVEGLRALRSQVAPLPVGVKLPHMGWNRVRRLKPSRLLDGLSEKACFYFAHSYAALEPDHATVAVSEHGATFVAALEQENMFAVQFHPEKSGNAGAQVLRNFLACVP